MRASSYPKIYNLGHSALGKNFLQHEFIVQEKVDGSQFTFGKIKGEVVARSKNQPLGWKALAEKGGSMFDKACEQVAQVAGALPDNMLFRAEYLRKPKHNTLTYHRVPTNHLMLFDIMTGEEDYDSRKDELEYWGNILHFEVVPELYRGRVTKAKLDELMDTDSVLGGNKIEGVVLKQYADYCPKTSKLLFAKVVSDAFREKHSKDWRERNQPGGIQGIIDTYRTEARWQKAVQHLTEDGVLKHCPTDIGPLMKEVSCDFIAECKEEVKEELWKLFGKKITKCVGGGLAQWYKAQLQESVFDESDS